MLKLTSENSDRYIAFYEDEAGFYRQPTQASLWHEKGRLQPQIHYSHSANTVMRMVGYLNPLNGAVYTWDYNKVTAERFCKTLVSLAALYPEKEKILIILDNWPVHFHPKVIKTLEKEPRIELVPLPTYSPWLNPIEKLWKWGKQNLIHTHPWSNDFKLFRQNVREQFEPLINGSNEILTYVGLLR